MSARPERTYHQLQLAARRWPAATLALVVLATAGCGDVFIWDDGGSTPTPTPTDTDSDSEIDTDIDLSGARSAALVRVVDGDSLEMLVDGEEVDIRLVGINAPELFVDDTESCNGVAAKQALADLVEGQPLVLVGDETDRFGRQLADVVIVGQDGDGDDAEVRQSVSRRMIEAGHGLAIGDDPDNRRRMQTAAAEGEGLWSEDCGARTDAGLAIGEIQVDPPGSDRDNLNDEWVTVVNEGQETVPLSGWILSDDTTGHRFELDGSLGPGEQLVVRSGFGSRSDDDFHLNETFPVWSNSGETVLLTTPQGVVQAWAFVDP